MSSESGHDESLESRLRLDAQAGPAHRISKERAKDLVLAALASLPEVAQAPEAAANTGAQGRQHSRWVIAAAALLFAFVSGASASFWLWGKTEAPRTSEPVLSPASKSHGHKPTTPAPVELEPAATEAAEPSPVRPPRSQEASPSRAAARESEDLLQRANQLRAEGHFAQARDGYEVVARRYPSSLSAYAALVAAGSLELEHLGHPDAARQRFERALATRPQGALSLEALQGLAESYAALDRRSDEQRTLDRLIRAYPEAQAAARARARLSELRPSR